MMHWGRYSQRMSVSGMASYKHYTYRDEQKIWTIELRVHALYSVSWKVSTTSVDAFNDLKVIFFGDNYTEHASKIKFKTESTEEVKPICDKLKSLIPYFSEIEAVILQDLQIQDTDKSIQPAARK